MPIWELCRLFLVERYEKPRLQDEMRWEHWVAVIDTPSGPKLIDQSPEYKHPHYIAGDEPKYHKLLCEQVEALRVEKSKLIGKLLVEGWEPISDVTFRRLVSS